MTKEDTGKTVKRKCVKSTPLRWTVIFNFLVICGIITGVDFVLKGWLMEFSTGDSDWSIKNVQANCPLWLYTSMRLQTQFGGGFELIAAMVFALLFLPRSRFFYYMFVSGFSSLTVLQLRLTFADPRPFHLDPRISPWKCFVTYGNPSDHAMCGILSAIVIILDLFHGVPITYNYAGDNIFYGWCTYLLAILTGLYWSATMTVSRYVGGMQSADQVIYGFSLGLVLGIFCHFVMRDPLIWFFEKIIHWQGESKGLLNFTKERSDGVARGDELGIEEVGLLEAQEHTLQGQAKEESKEFRPYTVLVVCIIAWFMIIAMGTTAFILDRIRYDKDSDDIKKWQKNMEAEGCGAYNHMNSFHNKMFPDIAIPTFHLASFVIFTQRKRIGLQLCYDYKIQDGSTISMDKGIAIVQIIIRACTFSALFFVYAMATKSAHAIKGEPSNSLGSQFVTMFEIRVVPLFLIAYLLCSGFYDVLVQNFTRCCVPKGKLPDQAAE